MAQENDIVLVHFEDNPIFFARIEDILADHKPDWYHVTLLIFQIPLQSVTWILRNAYINGDEFTMNGKRMRLEKIPDCGQFSEKESSRQMTESSHHTDEKTDTDEHGPAEKDSPEDEDTKVISFAQLRKNKNGDRSS